MVSVVIAGDGALASSLAEHYRSMRAEVVAVSFEQDLDAQAQAIVGPLDLVVIADGYEPARGPLSGADRSELGRAMLRLTYSPFRVATLLKPRLTEANGRLVLITRADARMEVPDTVGRYRERPFRTAAHALWRCLSVEWRDAGITVGLVGLGPDARPAMSDLAEAIAGPSGEAFPVELTDPDGQPLGW